VSHLNMNAHASITSSFEPLKPSKPQLPKIIGFNLPVHKLWLALYPPVMWLLQKMGSLDINVNIFGYTVYKVPAVVMCITSCCIALRLFTTTRKYYLPDRDDTVAKKWNPQHLLSCCYCLLSPTSIIPLVVKEISNDSRDNQPALWLAVAILQGYLHLLIFNLFFLREKIDAAVFQEAYQTEVEHRDAMDSARRLAEREVFERAGLYASGGWKSDPRQHRDGGGRPRLPIKTAAW
jgi:hypothetical protein